MAHKTLVGGTSYNIKGGKTLVNGTGYSIKKGRALVGGTGYDVSFNATWQKWSVKTNTTYGYEKKSTLFGAEDTLYDFGQIYYSATFPAINTTGSGVVWQGMSQIASLTFESLPYTLPYNGYYCQENNNWRWPSLALMWRGVAGETIEQYLAGTFKYAKINPSSEELYYGVVSETQVKNTLIEEVTAPDGTYPDDGVQDGYWYIKIS